MRELDVFHREASNKCLVKAQPLSFSSLVAAAPHPGKAMYPSTLFPLPPGHPPGRLLFIPPRAIQKPLLPGSPPGLPTKVVLCTHCPGCFP